MRSRRRLGLCLGVLAVAGAAAGLAAAFGNGGDHGEPTLAFDCAPPNPGRAQRLGDTLCVGTSHWRRRLPALQAVRLKGAAETPRWSPDGRRLLFRLGLSRGDEQRDDIGMIDLDGSSYVDLTNVPEHGNWGAAWAPDGRRIAFNSGSRLFVMNADGSHLRQITRIWGEFPYWSPDGKLIAFQSNRCACNGPDGSGAYDVYTVRPDGSGLHRLTRGRNGESTAGWSPDGRFLAFNRNPDNAPGIWIIPRRGGRVRHLLPRAPGVQLRGAEWARDGSFLVFAIPAGVANEEATHTFVYRVSENGRTATKLLDDAGGADVRPSAAGKAIAHLSLASRWLSQTGLELSGRLTVAGHGTVGRRVVLGRLGKTLPTERLRTVMTGTDGRFRLRLGVRNRRRWRVATAFFRGSRREWSTTAFASLAP